MMIKRKIIQKKSSKLDKTTAAGVGAAGAAGIGASANHNNKNNNDDSTQQENKHRLTQNDKKRLQVVVQQVQLEQQVKTIITTIRTDRSIMMIRNRTNVELKAYCCHY